jgi:Polyketide cyclase / dehydrase and lipid transport
MGALLVSLLTFSTIGAGYSSIGVRDGVEVFLRKDTGAIELAAVGEFDASPAEVQAALLDYQAHPTINKHLAESSILSKNPGELFVYQHLKLPMVKDRDFTLRVTWADLSVRFAIDGARGPAATANAVRLSILDGDWQLEPIRGGSATRAFYHVHIDLAGSIPRWMVRGGAAKDIPGVYSGMRTLILVRRQGITVSRR